jgi:phosphoribosylamine--glycine ligase
MADVAECAAGPPEGVDADLYVVGPEAPLVDGLGDRLRAAGKVVFGPGADGARLEGSKAWMKEVLVAAGVPTAGHRAFAPGDAGDAAAYLRSLPGPWVVKTDGLAAGKGVLVATDVEEAVADADAKLRTGGVVVEEGLTGPELSILALCDGTRAVPLPAARDFKRVGDGDTGPNTGGMGAHSPVPGAGDDVVAEVMERAVGPTLAALRDRGVDFRGVLYAGLMLTPAGPKVLEYNVRFGDPEAEVVLPRIDDDLAAWLQAAALGGLPDGGGPSVAPGACVTVVMASPGYPTAPLPGARINGVERAASLPRVRVYHAGTAVGPDGALVAAGGRVLAVTGSGSDLAGARAAAYAGVAAISFDGAVVRHDIGGAG